MKTLIGTLSMVALAVSLLLTPSGNVDPAYADYRVCEVWRDYYYNVHTNEFVEWVGEPYVSDVCWNVPDGTPRPRNTTSNDPKEGIGQGLSGDEAEAVRKARCRQCGDGYNACLAGVRQSGGNCLAAHASNARDQCVSGAVGNPEGGTTVRGFTFHDLLMGHQSLPGYGKDDWSWGWSWDRSESPAIRIPTGPGFRNCISSYRQDHPGWSYGNTFEAGVSATVKMPPFEAGGNAGVTTTSTASWGGKIGYHSACTAAQGAATTTCATALSSCQQRYSCTSEETGTADRDVGDNSEPGEVFDDGDVGDIADDGEPGAYDGGFGDVAGVNIRDGYVVSRWSFAR